MPAIVLDSSSDLPQSSEPCSSCSARYPGPAAWTTSILSPGAEEELYAGRDIHVETHLRGLYGLAEGDAEVVEADAEVVEADATGDSVLVVEDGEDDDVVALAEKQQVARSWLTFFAVAAAAGYATRVAYGRWGFADLVEGPFLRADVIVPVAVGLVAGTVVTNPTSKG